jgi:iron(II)-dependent oxidoreductase
VFNEDTYEITAPIGNQPVTGVTWYGAQAYCEAIGRRLPTEAEWEFAARGVTGYIYPWGNQWDAAFAKTSIPVTGEVGALPVGSYRSGASMFGLMDMAGNVAEWVQDWYDPSYYQQLGASGENPTGAAAGVEKVIRGGSWDAKPFFARSVHRQSREPHTSGAWLGFRCAADKTDQIVLTISPAPTRTPVLATPTATASR